MWLIGQKEKQNCPTTHLVKTIMFKVIFHMLLKTVNQTGSISVLEFSDHLSALKLTYKIHGYFQVGFPTVGHMDRQYTYRWL